MAKGTEAKRQRERERVHERKRDRKKVCDERRDDWVTPESNEEDRAWIGSG